MTVGRERGHRKYRNGGFFYFGAEKVGDGGRFLLSSGREGFRACLAQKRLTGTKMRRYIGQQTETKSVFRPANKTRVKRRICFPIGLHSNSFGRASREKFRIVFFRILGSQEVVSSANRARRRPDPPRPALLRRPAMRCPDPTRPLYVRVLGSTSGR